MKTCSILRSTGVRQGNARVHIKKTGQHDEGDFRRGLGLYRGFSLAMISCAFQDLIYSVFTKSHRLHHHTHPYSGQADVYHASHHHHYSQQPHHCHHQSSSTSQLSHALLSSPIQAYQIPARDFFDVYTCACDSSSLAYGELQIPSERNIALGQAGTATISRELWGCFVETMIRIS